MSLILFIIYIVALILMIRTFIRCMKHKSKWLKLFVSEIAFLLISNRLMVYYDSLPGYGFMPGLTYLGEVLASYVAMVAYAILLALTTFIRILLYLITKKKEGKNYFPMIAIVIALILLIPGICYFAMDMQENLSTAKTDAVIVGYKDNEYGYERPIVRYQVKGNTYEAMIDVLNDRIKTSTIGDELPICYDKKNPSQLVYLSSYEIIYVPCLLISIVLFFLAIRQFRLMRLRK
ncbi:MAG: hypothetical protein J1E61_02485 [Lachnospiraceae bacterium]|nr:hypothetical protein [Lachnospiraceae bacterium]